MRDTAGRGGCPLLQRDFCPLLARKEGLPMMITYAHFIQSCIFIVALVGLCYKIFKEK